MKKLLFLGVALLGLCALGQTARAGSDEPEYSCGRPAPRVYEDRPVDARCYLPPPPPPLYFAPPPVVIGYGYPRFHRHPYPYRYGYGYRPGLHIGIGF